MHYIYSHNYHCHYLNNLNLNCAQLDFAWQKGTPIISAGNVIRSGIVVGCMIELDVALLLRHPEPEHYHQTLHCQCWLRHQTPHHHQYYLHRQSSVPASTCFIILGNIVRPSFICRCHNIFGSIVTQFLLSIISAVVRTCFMILNIIVRLSIINAGYVIRAPITCRCC